MDLEEIEFWKQRVNDRTLLAATKSYPERAKSFFGEKAVLRGNIVELGIILSARKILTEPAGQSTFDISEIFDKNAREIFDDNIRRAIEEMDDDQRSVVQKLLSRESQDAATRELAAQIIESATRVS